MSGYYNDQKSAAMRLFFIQLVSQDSSGRYYQVTIPFGENVSLVIPSSYFSIANAVGLPLSNSETVAPLLVPAGQAPPTITLAITGGGK
jgi:hypothetical protein